MDPEKNIQGVTCIVPAYNEAARIYDVLAVLTSYKKFHEIIVIDDGSTDETVSIIKKFPVTLLQNEKNMGKGMSMDRGVAHASTSVIFFCDADISGLTHSAIDAIVDPVLNGEVEMFIGMRNRKIYLLHQFLLFVPFLGGERALTKRLWQMLPDYYKDRFKIETGLNFFASHYGKDFRFHVFSGISQVVKEKKYGFWNGLKQRIGMMKDIFLAQMRLEFVDLPKSQRKARTAFMNLLLSLGGVAVGTLALIMASQGPVAIAERLFQRELAQDASAPLYYIILIVTERMDLMSFTIAAILLLSFSFLFFLFSLNRARPFFRRFKSTFARSS